jgi:hypothetical protein
LFRENRDTFDENQTFKGDLGYKGEESIETPIKKTKKKNLTEEQKEHNRKFSAKRVLVEHKVRSVKIFRVFQERFRLSSKKISTSSFDYLWASKITNWSLNFININTSNFRMIKLAHITLLFCPFLNRNNQDPIIPCRLANLRRWYL